MTKILLVGLMLAMLLSFTAPAQADTICGGPSFYRVTDEELVQLVNDTPDLTRWCMYENGELPEAPQGYYYISDDMSIAPLS